MTVEPREDLITEDSEEDPIIKDSKGDLLPKIFSRTETGTYQTKTTLTKTNPLEQIVIVRRCIVREEVSSPQFRNHSPHY